MKQEQKANLILPNELIKRERKRAIVQILIAVIFTNLALFLIISPSPQTELATEEKVEVKRITPRDTHEILL